MSAVGTARERGFTYFAVLFLVVALGLAAAAAGQVWQKVREREKETELLAIGHEFRIAIARYVQATPSGPRQYPRHLEDLVRDPRAPGVARHLRRVYADPVTGRPEWGLVTAPGGGIMGVHSLSQASPLKRRGFRPQDARFADATSHADWVFVHRDRDLPRSAPRR